MEPLCTTRRIIAIAAGLLSVAGAVSDLPAEDLLLFRETFQPEEPPAEQPSFQPAFQLEEQLEYQPEETAELVPPGGVEYYTTGAPFPGDGGVFFHFPEDPPGPLETGAEILPTLLTYPSDPLADFTARVLHAERAELHTELDEEPLDIQYVAPRPPLIIEWNERFLGPGLLAPGVELSPFGPTWRPAIWMWGEIRTAVQYYDNRRPQDPIVEWANRVDLFWQLNLTGTERFLFAARPVDRETSVGTSREFAGYDFRDGDPLPGGNFQPQSAFFEGDFGEIFPVLDPYDTRLLDYGFSVGRMPLLAQQGLLLNEDRLDAVTLTRNTLNLNRILNMRITGVYSWGEINRNSPIAGNGNRVDNNSRMVALLTETDFHRSTVNADVAYVGGDDSEGDLMAFGVSGIQRSYLHHNTYNTSLHVLASFPTGATTPYAQQGELLFAQTSWTPHHYYDLIYLNAFLAIDQFTSPARGPLMGGPLGQTGIIFSAPGVGRAGPPIGVLTNDSAGASLGYQWFFDETRKQLIWEIGGAKEYEGPTNRGALATTLRYQTAIGQHFIFVLDGFVAKQEALDVGSGARAELRMKF